MAQFWNVTFVAHTVRHHTGKEYELPESSCHVVADSPEVAVERGARMAHIRAGVPAYRSLVAQSFEHGSAAELDQSSRRKR
jgi:hypothetical protein